jgi:hypothetical protein
MRAHLLNVHHKLFADSPDGAPPDNG